MKRLAPLFFTTLSCGGPSGPPPEPPRNPPAQRAEPDEVVIPEGGLGISGAGKPIGETNGDGIGIGSLEALQPNPNPPGPTPGGTTAVGFPIQVDGDADLDLIARVAKLRAPELNHCYEQRLEVEPGLRGEIHLDVTLEAGAVTGVEVASDTIADPELTECLLTRTRSWQLPADAVPNAVVRIPCSFVPKDRSQ